MKLNARQIDTAKPKEKAYKLADGGGLYLLVKPSGGKYWRFKYRVAGKEKLLALGVYPEVTLADARAKREEAKRGIAGGIDPMEAKREEKIARETQLNNTFKDIALEWHSSKLKKMVCWLCFRHPRSLQQRCVPLHWQKTNRRNQTT